MLFAGAVLAFSLFTGCKQGNGDRCEVASDCSSNYCVPGAGSPNSICCDPLNLSTCVVQVAGTGGSSGSGGSGGTSETADAADATIDSPTSPADDASADSSTD
jgi:hypothetical protein